MLNTQRRIIYLLRLIFCIINIETYLISILSHFFDKYEKCKEQSIEYFLKLHILSEIKNAHVLSQFFIFYTYTAQVLFNNNLRNEISFLI